MLRFLAKLDRFTLMLVATVLLACVIPCRGAAVEPLDWLITAAIALLFFFYGARLSREAVKAGAAHWRLHGVVLISTFAVFPALGLLIKTLLPGLLPQPLYLGVLFLCCLPSTVQSSIAFTSIARGNVPAAIFTASISNLFGIVATPLLAGLMLAAQGDQSSMRSAQSILYQILLPFLAGQVLQPWIGGWMKRHAKKLGLLDRGSILLMVYSAFSKTITGGLWHQLPPVSLVTILGVNAVLLAIVLAITNNGAKLLGFSREDRIAIVFCGSKKSLVTGASMANALFAGSMAGGVVLPLIVFHQLQLFVCAVIARRFAAQIEEPAPALRELQPKNT